MKDLFILIWGVLNKQTQESELFFNKTYKALK